VKNYLGRIVVDIHPVAPASLSTSGQVPDLLSLGYRMVPAGMLFKALVFNDGPWKM
jgi:hypothetical protein